MPSATYLPVLPSGFVTNVLIGGTNLAGKVRLETLEIESSGNQNIGQLSCIVVDKNSSVAITDKAFVQAFDSYGQLFKGFIDSRQPRAMAIGREISIQAHGIESELDTNIVVENTRANNESDKARIQWLLSTYCSLRLYNSGWGSTDVSKIQVLRANMPDQKFKNQTVRQVLESILGLASDSSDYYIDPNGRLHTFDTANPEPDTAPYTIRVAHTLGAGEVAPEDDYDPEWDSQGLINFYRVRAKKRIFDVYRSDAASIALYGRYQGYVDAPDADTVAKAERVGDAALKDNAAPKVRGSFKVSSPYDVNGTTPWKVGQKVTLWSTIHGLNGDVSRIVNVRMKYLNGEGEREVVVQHGGDRLRLRSQGTGSGSSSTTNGATVTGDIG